MKYNQSIHGIHLNGHGWFINSKGFLKLAKDSKFDYTQLNYILPGVPRSIDGCKFTGYNEIRSQISKDEELPMKLGDNCWICEGWY